MIPYALKNHLKEIWKNFIPKEPKSILKQDTPSTSNSTENSTLKTVIKLNKNVMLHQCSKCSRVFGRKSSQVSHEKFCIMNAIKVETVDLTGGPISPPPNVSFLSLSPKPVNPDLHFHKPINHIQHPPSDIKISTRPKRGAEKQMHKDFVNSQTLKWRSANRVDTNAKVAQTVKKSNAKNLEKKVSNIMNVKKLLCTKCDKIFSSYSNLRRHVAIHVGWTRFKCKYCEYQAYNKSQCWTHVQKAHGVAEYDLDKSIVSLNNNSPCKSPVESRVAKSPDVKVKQIPTKTNGIPKVKITRKQIPITYSKYTSDKKLSPTLKKGNLDKKEDTKRMRSQSLDSKKEVYLKKDKSQNGEAKKENIESKKERSTENKKNDIKKEKNQIVDSKKDKIIFIEKDVMDMKKEKNSSIENKIDITEVKKDNQSLGPIFKYNISDYKKDASNYKSVTTNNPTTIILSKKFPASTVQSFVTVSPESLSSSGSTKMFPLRSSPRKIEAKAPEESKLTTLVTRSTAYLKGPLQVKMSMVSSSEEDVKRSTSLSPEKTYAKKDRLISEWFPKKDLNSNSVRRESAPLIIGLVPATNAGNKSPVISSEKSNS
ncbi:uncharacterized protein CEXT_318981 [Caerostris extrusa]|uniref:C2H2-type domain-containing protein n=1 Tax=Caerostris extrusa TaxID=172846 RepID=A0AAV4NCT5_CAEEX|nr:uncharacterized protein CEXT_318981 [Caerostris extrusa]